MPEAGVTLTGQRPASADVVLDADAHTVTDLWRRLFAESHRVREYFIRAVREFARGRTVPEVYDALAERDVPYFIRSRIRSVAQGDRREAWRLVAEIAPAVGSDVGTVGDLHATAGVFDELADAVDAGDLEPLTVTLTLGSEFRNRRRDQREATLALVARLAAVADVRILATGLTRRWLASEHRADLPGVSGECTDRPDRGPVSERVERALGTLAPESTAVGVLRRLADAPAETRAYAELYADAALPGDSRIRQVLGDLADLGLVESFGARSDRKVDLLDAGREFLARLDAETGRQRTLEDVVSEPGKYSTQFREQREHARPPQLGGGEDGAARYTTAYLDRAGHAAAAGVAADGAVTVVQDRLRGAEQREGPDRARYVSVDRDRDEVVVAVRATGPLQHMVSAATALASPLLLDEALPPGRLADVLDESPAILRDARCIGALSDDVLADPEAFRAALVEWGEDLAALTTKLHRGEYDDRRRFRSEILRSAHGLAGTVAHVLDVAGVDVVREVRVPGGLDREQLSALAKSVGVATAIQSRYGGFASYRQLYETREAKRETALRPDVDATDPVGELIGSVVVRGPDVHRIEPALASALREPADLHDDAPEFAVAVPIREAGREAVRATAERVLGGKRLSVTPAAVSVLHGLVSSPYAVARALHQLAPASTRRRVRASDLRYALGTVPAEALLEALPPTVGAVLAALLRVDPDRRLSTADLADAADVSTRSVRNHRETLTALDLVRKDGDGWYVSLAPQEPEDSDGTTDPGPAYPRLVEDDRPLSEVVSDVAAAVLPPPEYADPGGPVSEALTWPPEPWALQENDRLDPWVALAGRLVDADPPDTTDRTVRMGPELEQTPLQEPSAAAPTASGA